MKTKKILLKCGYSITSDSVDRKKSLLLAVGGDLKKISQIQIGLSRMRDQYVPLDIEYEELTNDKKYLDKLFSRLKPKWIG